MTPKRINLNDTAAKVLIELKFTDGDGNLGNSEDPTEESIFIKDSRDTSQKLYSYTYPFPYIPQYMRPSGGGLEGFISINLGKEYFSITDSLHLALRKDTLYFRIYIEDEGKVRSNILQTDTLYLEF